jgi:hypothetical protein
MSKASELGRIGFYKRCDEECGFLLSVDSMDYKLKPF